MPYIAHDQRTLLEPELSRLCELLSGAGIGCVNYAFTRVLLARGLDSYSQINEAMGVLECVKAELYRRKAALLEDQKMIINGDVEGMQ